MTSITNRSLKAVFTGILILGAIAPSFALAQNLPSPSEPPTVSFPSTTASPKAAEKPRTATPAGPGSPITVVPAAAPEKAQQAITLPPNLEGVVTLAEFKKFIEFQAKLRNDPKIKELNDNIMFHVQELQKLQPRLDALRKEAISSDPEAKAAGDKIEAALRPNIPPPGANLPKKN